MASWEELYETGAERLGWSVLPLVLDPARWIQRRVEDITISSQRLVRRAVTVDLVLPALGPERDALRLDPADDATPLILPLGMLRKEQLIDFDLAEGTTSLMLVRSGLNVVIAGGLLGNIASAEGRSPADVAAAQPWLRRIAGPDKAAAHRAYQQLFRGEGDVPQAARSLAAGQETSSVARQLRDSYLLLVELPDGPARRRLIRFATDQTVRNAGTRLHHRLGWRPVAIEFGIPGANQAASYHAEFTVPDGCLVSGAGMGHGASVVPASVDLGGGRATIYPLVELTDEAEATLHIGQDPRFFFLPAAVISLLVSVLLAVGVTVAWTGGKPNATASTLVLSGLSAITGLVIQRDEDALTSELHDLARIVLIAVTVAALSAAGAIAFGAAGRTLAGVWTGDLVLSVLGAGTLSVGAFQSVRGKQRAST